MANHPLSRSLLSKSHFRKDLDASSFDIDSTTCNNSPGKDIGEYSFKSPTHLPLELSSSEDKILENMKAVIGDNSVSEFRSPLALE